MGIVVRVILELFPKQLDTLLHEIPFTTLSKGIAYGLEIIALKEFVNVCGI